MKKSAFYLFDASFGFGYDVNGWNVYGKVQHFIETDVYTDMKAGIGYKF